MGPGSTPIDIWRKVKVDWEAWCRRDLAGEDIVRLLLDGTVARVRLDRKAISISLLVVLGVRRDGHKVLLAVRDMGGESSVCRNCSPPLRNQANATTPTRTAPASWAVIAVPVPMSSP